MGKGGRKPSIALSFAGFDAQTRADAAAISLIDFGENPTGCGWAPVLAGRLEVTAIHPEVQELRALPALTELPRYLYISIASRWFRRQPAATCGVV